VAEAEIDQSEPAPAGLFGRWIRGQPGEHGLGQRRDLRIVGAGRAEKGLARERRFVLAVPGQPQVVVRERAHFRKPAPEVAEGLGGGGIVAKPILADSSVVMCRGALAARCDGRAKFSQRERVVLTLEGDRRRGKAIGRRRRRAFLGS
jgi:hypothetical protein